MQKIPLTKTKKNLTYIHTQTVFILRTKKRALRLNSNVFNICRNIGKDRSDRRSSGGRSFRCRGLAAEKLLLPNLSPWDDQRTEVGGTTDRRVRLLRSDSNRQSSGRYDGATPANDWYMSHWTLKVTCWWTGSQCSCRSSGEMWSHQRASATICAAAFNTDCRQRWST